MGERALRRRYRKLLRELDIQPPLNIDELCTRLGQHRDRPIELYPFPIVTPGPFGLWFALEDADAIFYQQETSQAHQAHIIAHELGHILAEHPSDEADSDPAAVAIRAALPGNGGTPRGRRRTCYDSEYEYEAELVATIMLEWASVVDTVVPRTSETDAARRLDSALGSRLGWL